MSRIDHTDMGDQPAGTPEVLHYLHDVLGSVVALTNTNGAVVERYDYDPYGTTYILDAAGVPRVLKSVDSFAPGGYYHDHDLDGDLDAGDYADLVGCIENAWFDPLCIYTHDRNGDRRVDFVDLGTYLADADTSGVPGGAGSPGLAAFGRPLRLAFDADGDGKLDLYDWYALQSCFDRDSPRCTHLFDADVSDTVDQPDLDAFLLAADDVHGGPKAKPWRPNLVASRYGNPFMWTGQRYDATTGQYHFWARTYSLRLGRWMQRDPIGYVDGLSLYETVISNPINGRDPLGLKRCGKWRLDNNPHHGDWEHIEFTDHKTRKKIKWEAETGRAIDGQGPLTVDDLQDLAAEGILDSIVTLFPNAPFVIEAKRALRDLVTKQLRQEFRLHALEKLSKSQRKKILKQIAQRMLRQLPLITILFFVSDAGAEGIKSATVNTVVPVDLIEDVVGILTDELIETFVEWKEIQIRNLRVRGLLDQGMTCEEIVDMTGLECGPENTESDSQGNGDAVHKVFDD